MRVLGVGIATLDIVNLVDEYPEEDSEVRIIDQRHSRGGNVTNTLVTLSQLGHECAWAGTLAEDSASDFVQQDLQHYRVNLDWVVHESAASLPVSYVTLSQRNGSRTIMHYRNLKEYSKESFAQIDVQNFDWIHFEGRNVEDLGEMMQSLHSRGYTQFSLEVEKPRKDIESLFHLPSLLLFSRDYVSRTHKGSVRDFFGWLRDEGIRVPVYCAWGKAGGWAMDVNGHLYQQPAWQPEKVIDTLGAGDVFNAAVIDASLKQQTVEAVLGFACRVAGIKCGQQGFDHIAEAL